MASTVAHEQLGITLEPEISELDSESSSGCDDRETRKRLRDDADNSVAGSPKKRRKQTTPVRFPTSLMGSTEDRPESEEEYDEEEEVEEADDDDVEAGNVEKLRVTRNQNDEYEDEKEEEYRESLLEGKPRTISPFVRNFDGKTGAAGAMSTKDENLNSEFRCQFCGLPYEGKDALVAHLESEHAIVYNALQAAAVASAAAAAAAVATTAGSASNTSPLSDSVRIKLEPSSQGVEDTENAVNLSGLSIKNFAANWLNSQAQAQQQMQSKNPDDWTSPGNLTSVPSHLQALTFPGALAQYLPLPTFSLTDNLTAGQLNRPSVGPAPIRIFNPDAYCDLCNKEFCNKYFLKTHRANKHGLYEAPTQNSGDGIAAVNMFPGVFPNPSIKLEQRLEVVTPQSTINTIQCEICQKRFKSDDQLRKHKQKVHSDGIDSQESHSLPGSGLEEDRDVSRSSPSAMESLFKQEFGVEQEDSKYMPAPRHLSPQSSQQARESGFNVDRLRRLGVINPEAFCEICCKEYCNKYFLRTHKMKRHGILIQDSDKPSNNSGNGGSWHQIQTSPLNLIVSDSNPGSSSESGDRPSEEYECKPCGIRFQTLGLYRSHQAKLHDVDDEKSLKQEFDMEASDQRTDSISEDLQKLQTMILQLNGLETSKKSSCTVCGKECENIGALRMHMNVEHGGMSEEIASPSLTNDGVINGASTVCTLCEKDYQTLEALRQHITEEHNPNNIPATIPQQNPAVSSSLPIQSTTPTVGTSMTIPVLPTPIVQTPTTPPTDRKVNSMTPTSSYCRLCRKELCNKYFMKTHMQKMHNIEIESGSQIGGVICNICNKELCSKYFLRVHKQNTHGIVDEGSTTSNKQESYESSSNDDSALKPDQLGDLSHRYFTHFTEACPFCNGRFRSIKWLKAHLLGEHGAEGLEKWRELEPQYQNTVRVGVQRTSGAATKPLNQNLRIPNGMEIVQQHQQQQQMKNEYVGLGNQVLSSLLGSTAEDQQAKNYRCSYCSFTTTVLPYLFLHERSHTSSHDNSNSGMESGPLQCPICSQSFIQPELLHHHLLTRHQFSGLLSQMPSAMINSQRLEGGSAERNNEVFEKGDYEIKEDRRQSSPQPSLGNAESVKSQKVEEPAIQVTPQGAYKCAQCDYVTANLNRIKKHIRKDHKTLGDPTQNVIDELTKTLTDVANKHKLPAIYGMPQDMNSNPDATTFMQPFFIEERDIGRTGDETSPERRFAPAIVYLPVRARINTALAASFTLSPA